MLANLETAALPSLDSVRAELERRKSEDQLAEETALNSASLGAFTRAGWHVLEPGTPLKWGWALDVMCEHLEAVTSGQIKRLLINVPPGMMKSLLVSVFWNAYEWGPAGLAHHRFMATAFREGIPIRDNRRLRNLIQSPWYQAHWRLGLVSDQNAKKRFENTSMGWREGMSFGSLTGERGDRVLLDDPISVSQARSPVELKTAEETFLEAVPLRVVDPKRSAIVVIMQRVNEKDPSGVILEKDLNYTHLMLPMAFEKERRCYTVVKPKGFIGAAREGRYDGPKQIWYFDGDEIPEPRRDVIACAKPKIVYPQDRRQKDGELLFPDRFSRETVEADKVSLGAMGDAGQNQQRPAPREGGMFKRANFKFIKKSEIPPGTYWVRGWDFAATESPEAAQTAGAKIGKAPDGRVLIGHCVRERLGPQGQRNLVKSTAEVDGYECSISVPQDPGQAGKVQAHDYVVMLMGWNITATTETGDKVTRAEPLAAQVEAGNVYIVHGPWVEGYLDEVSTFPNGKFKDAVDASSRAFTEIVMKGVPFNSEGKIT